MVDRTNLQVIVTKFLSVLSAAPKTSAAQALASVGSSSTSSAAIIITPAYKITLIDSILSMSSRSLYANVTNFPWFIELLATLAQHASSLGAVSSELEIGRILVDVSARAKAVRPFAVSVCIKLLSEGLQPTACAWIIGEYCSDAEQWKDAIRTLEHAGQLYAAVKVFARWSNSCIELNMWQDDATLGDIKYWAEVLKDSSHVASVCVALYANKLRLIRPTEPGATSSLTIGLGQPQSFIY